MADGEQPEAPAPKSTAMIKAGGGVQAIVPQSFDEAWRIAQALSKSGMCPQGMDKPEQVLVAIMAGAEIGMAPFQAVQSFAVINNRPALWGDGMMATVRRFGVTVEERIEGEGDAAQAICIVNRPDTKERIVRTFSVQDAKAAKLWGKTGPWTNYPKRMLQMRARAWALRDGCADMLRGMKMAEEAQDYTEVISSEPLPDMDMSRPPVEKVLNEATGRMVDPYCANQIRKPGGKWDTMTDAIQGYKEAKNAEGLKAWSLSAEIVDDLAKWPRSWREAMEQEIDAAYDFIIKADGG